MSGWQLHTLFSRCQNNILALPSAALPVQIARTEGLGAFMSGWQPRLMWISLGGFVFFPALEAAKKLYSPDGRGMHSTPSDTQFVIEELEAEEEAKLKKSKKK
jgi:hypothetical protein